MIQDCNLILKAPASADGAWCVYEHHMTLLPGAPPDCVYIAATKLADVFLMREARENSEWRKITAPNDRGLLVRIVATHPDRASAYNDARTRIMARPRMPVCNERGYSTHRAASAITSTDGRTFNTQAEAARAYGVSQAAISQHLSGLIPQIKGETLKKVMQ